MIAYLILVHRYPEQFKRLFNAIYHPFNHYLVHIDKTSGEALLNDITLFLEDYPNSSVLESEDALWGGYSLVNIELRGMEKLMEIDKDWTHFINLSGQDFPLKTQEYIHDFLSKNENKEFIYALDQNKTRPDTMDRIANMSFESEGQIYRPNMPREFMDGVVPFIGTQWMIVSRRFCDFVCHSEISKSYKKFYKHTFIADEGFFQTVMMNNDCHGEVVQDDLRLIDWVPDGDIKLRPRTFTVIDEPELIVSNKLFARKFDLLQDAQIIDRIEHHLSSSL
ncbi:beta-1,6-N-acetylglucosaminyltransferase [Aliivibrio fischeri]|uniref:Peptide O-xylosyltransferase n=1 Tax=Aliivibrio fischeri TaxID=668 RepID=A0A510USG3_ALIFS|nr:beta-1,6-N-acetylglucosaminyltransferase [Aliivibrio fischeri]MUK51430.1 glycosyl transferase [Aliivibrio fischeri]GEK16160.1 glycosyl transferase [Aliivibrio fischeri]